MVVTKKTTVSNKKQCNRCNNVYTISKGFYKLAQPDENFPDQHSNVCRKCTVEDWEDEANGFKAFIDFLRIANIPYKKDLYNEVETKPTYLQRVRIVYSNDRFIDSDTFTEEKASISASRGKLKELTQEQVEDCELFWGSGYSEEEYLYLMNEYSEYENDYEIDNKAMRDLMVQVVSIGLQIRTANEEGRDPSKLIDAQQKVLTAANIKPTQEKASSENANNNWGNWIKKIENEMPIGDPLPEYRDVDGIVKYVKAFFTAPMARSMGLDNPFPEEYEEMVQKLTVDRDEDGDI